MGKTKKDDSPQNIDLNVLLNIYERVNDIQRYEGEGIWNRFNILVSLNIVLFGAVTFILSAQIPYGLSFIRIVACFGCLLCLWAIYVLQRLWLWHIHWKNTLQKLESDFPIGLPKPFSDRPSRLKKSSSWIQHWLLAYTQPFMLIIFLIWFSLALLTFSTDFYSHEKENKKEIKQPEKENIIKTIDKDSSNRRNHENK